MINFLKVSITVYIFYMFLYAIWYFLQVVDLANLRIHGQWAGSLCYLPHGARVLMICFFRYRALPALYLAEITGPNLVNNDDFMMEYITGWYLGSIGCLASVVIAVEIVKWSRVSPGVFSFFKPVNFKNYKFLLLVIIISSLLSGVLCNSILAVLNESITIDVLTVLRFMIGDFLGALTVIIAMWVVFTTAIDTRLIISPDKE